MKLSEIAQQMKQYAQANPYLNPGQIKPYQRQLKGGLVLTCLVNRDSRWVVSLSRTGIYPSVKEIEIIKREFGIPEDHSRETSEFGGWCSVRLSWPVGQELEIKL